MNKQEVDYLNEVRAILAHNAEADVALKQVTAIQKPSRDELSANTNTVIRHVNDFEFEYNARDLEEGEAEEVLRAIQRTLSDIEKGNLYKEVFWAELAYSKLQNTEYLYKIINQKMESKTIEEAKHEKQEIKEEAPKQHPEDSDYSLEDVRVNIEIIDSNGNTVEKPKFLLN